MPSEERILEALLRNDFRAFLHKVFTTLAPGITYVPSWHIEAIAWRLEQVRRGEILGGSLGAGLVVAADELLVAKGIRQPERWLALHAPGFNRPAAI